MKLYIKPQSEFIEVNNESLVIMTSKLPFDPGDSTDEQLIGAKRETLDWNE